MLNILTNFSRNNWARKRVGGDISNSEITRFIKIQSVKFKIPDKKSIEYFPKLSKSGQIVIWSNNDWSLSSKERITLGNFDAGLLPPPPDSNQSIVRKIERKKGIWKVWNHQGVFSINKCCQKLSKQTETTYFHYFSGGDTGKNLPKTFAFRKREYESPAKVNFRLV